AYDADRFDPATVRRLAGHLRRILTAVAEAPDRPLARLPWLSEVERQRVLTASTGAPLVVPSTTVPELFAAQARRTPDATALVCGEARLTFAELAARVDRLAGHLAARGAGPETVVALSLPRERMVPALLAVLRSGAAALALDPAQPAERTAFVLR